MFALLFRGVLLAKRESGGWTKWRLAVPWSEKCGGQDHLLEDDHFLLLSSDSHGEGARQKIHV